MKTIAFTFFAVLVSALIVLPRNSDGTIQASSNFYGSNLFIASKIQRCALEDFMVQHRMLYHVTLSRSDAIALVLLCKKQSEVQTTISMN